MDMNTFQIILTYDRCEQINMYRYNTICISLECDFGISSPAYTFSPLAKHLAPGTRNWFQLMFSSVMLLFSAEFEKKDLSDKILCLGETKLILHTVYAYKGFKIEIKGILPQIFCL